MQATSASVASPSAQGPGQGWTLKTRTEGVCAQSVSRVPLSAAPCTVARQAPLAMGIPRQEHWEHWAATSFSTVVSSVE